MTTGNILYLAMVIAVFGMFGGVLAYQSWQQTRRGPEMLEDRTRHPATNDGITA